MKQQEGFSLVELLVSISIFGILAAAIVVNIRGSSSGREAELQAQNLSSFLQTAQVNSLSGQPHEGSFPLGGYGVHMQVCATAPCTAILFADVDQDGSFDASEEVSQITFGSSVYISEISTGSDLDVVFKPPRPFICINNSCSGAGVTTIDLDTVNSGQTSQVIIDQISGRIST